MCSQKCMYTTVGSYKLCIQCVSSHCCINSLTYFKITSSNIFWASCLSTPWIWEWPEECGVGKSGSSSLSLCCRKSRVMCVYGRGGGGGGGGGVSETEIPFRATCLRWITSTTRWSRDVVIWSTIHRMLGLGLGHSPSSPCLVVGLGYSWEDPLAWALHHNPNQEEIMLHNTPVLNTAITLIKKKSCYIIHQY